MGRNPGLVYVKGTSGKLVRVKSQAKLDQLDRDILESGARTPSEANRKLGISLLIAESRMMRKIPAIFGVETFAEAQKIYLNRLPIKI